MAQWGGPVLAGLGGLCEGGGLVTEAAGTSIGGVIGLWVTAACGPCGAGTACLGAVQDTAELIEYVTSLLSSPLTVTSKEAGLLYGGMITLLGWDVVVTESRLPLCSSEHRLITSNC